MKDAVVVSSSNVSGRAQGCGGGVAAKAFSGIGQQDLPWSPDECLELRRVASRIAFEVELLAFFDLIEILLPLFLPLLF